MYPTSSIFNLVTRVGNSRSLLGVKDMLTPYGERGEKVGETQHEGAVCSTSIYEVYCQFCLDNVPDSLFCPVKVCLGSDLIG